jgi:mannose-6-phosphate isomerase-like protein (cupin superfamily)
MGHHVVDPADLDRVPDRPSDMRYVSEAAGMEHMGLRRYRVEPGEQLPISGLHYHDEQEEAFYVVSGTLTVETPDREYVVEADQFFVADPGSAHRAYVASDATSEAIVIGMGAPPVSGDAHHYEA